MVDLYETNVRLKRERWVLNVELLTTRVPADVGLLWDKYYSETGLLGS